MRHVLLIAVMLGVAAIGGTALSPTGQTRTSQREVALVEFTQQVKLLGVFLRGEYLIVHDDANMDQGGACTFIYSRRAGEPDKLVASFHCTPVARKTVDRFTVKTTRVSASIEIPQITEFQFAGSGEAHQVPTE